MRSTIFLKKGNGTQEGLRRQSGNTEKVLGCEDGSVPEPGLALLRGQLVEGLGFLFAQEGLVVVLVALGVVVGMVAQIALVVHAFLLRRHGEAERQQHREDKQLHFL